MHARLATLALIWGWLLPGACLAQDRPLVEELPKGMAVERAMQIAQSALAARGWRITSNQSTTIEAEDRSSKIRLSVADGAIRYRDLALTQGGRDPWAKGLYESMQQQQRREPIPAQRIAELRTDLVAALGGNAASAKLAEATPGFVLLGNLPANLTNDQILRAVWTALSGRRWIVLPSGSDTVIAEYTSGDTEGKLKVFIAGRDLRYTDEGTRQRSSGAFTSLPENWLANLRADTSRALGQLSTARQSAGASPPAAASAPSASARTAAERMRALKELHDSGVITRDEYDRKRAEILKDL